MLPAIFPVLLPLFAGDISPILRLPDQGTCTVTELLPANAVATTRFGTSISVDGTTLAVAGADIVWVYELAGQTLFLEQQIDSPLTCPGSFGEAIALDADRLVIGAPNNGVPGNYSGAVLVYERVNSVWFLVQQLAPSDLIYTQGFGEDIELQGDRLAISDWRADNVKGAVYVFEHDGVAWIETAKITNPIAVDGDAFGHELSMDSDRIVAAMQGDQPPSFWWTGSVFVYEENGGAWLETAEVLPAALKNYDGYGSALAVHGDLLAVGSSRADDYGPGSGAAYLFEWDGSTWVERQNLAPSSVFAGSLFGEEVDMDETSIVIGATNTTLGGSVTVFRESAGVWGEFVFSENPDDIENSDYGAAASLDGDFLVVGAPLGDLNGFIDSGRATVFSLDGRLCSTLTASRPRLSLSAGGCADFLLTPGPEFRGDFYAVAGSLMGTDPGFVFAGTRIPLNPDSYFFLLLSAGLNSPLINGTGILDNKGTATATLVLPPNSDPSLVGLTLQHAYVVLEVAPLLVVHTSNAVGVVLCP